MKCPICGNPLRPSKKDPSYGLCDNCRKKFKLKTKTNPAAKSAEKKSKQSEPKKTEPKQTEPKQTAPEKKKNHKLFKFFLFFFLIVVLAGAAYFFFGKDDDSNVPSDSSAQSTDSDTTEQSFSDTALYEETFNDIQFSLISTIESEGSDLSSPSEGNIFYICEFEIINNSANDIIINSLADLEAYCGDYSVSEDISGLLLPETEGKNSLDGTIAAGQTFTGVVTYQIPADYEQMQFRISPIFWDGDSATFTVPKE